VHFVILPLENTPKPCFLLDFWKFVGLKKKKIKQNVTPNVTPNKTFRFCKGKNVTPNVTPSVTPNQIFAYLQAQKSPSRQYIYRNERSKPFKYRLSSVKSAF